MPVETATRIDQLTPATPGDAEYVTEGAQHIRLIKQTLKNSFANFTQALTATAEKLNSVGSYFTAAGALVLPLAAGGGSAIRWISDNINLPAFVIQRIGNFTIFSSSQDGGGTSNLASVSHVDGTWTFPNVMNAGAVQQGGVVLVPPGMIAPFYRTTVPAGWLLCDGTLGTPNLVNKFVLGTTLPSVGAGGGAFIHEANTDSAGDHNHAMQGAGGHNHNGETSVAGSHNHYGATQGHSLSLQQLPPHTHQTPGGVGVASGPNNGLAGPGTSQTGEGNGLAAQPHGHSIDADGAHSHTVTTQSVGDHIHGVLNGGAHVHHLTVDCTPPYFALIYCMKV